MATERRGHQSKQVRLRLPFASACVSGVLLACAGSSPSSEGPNAPRRRAAPALPQSGLQRTPVASAGAPPPTASLSPLRSARAVSPTNPPVERPFGPPGGGSEHGTGADAVTASARPPAAAGSKPRPKPPPKAPPPTDPDSEAVENIEFLMLLDLLSDYELYDEEK